MAAFNVRLRDRTQIAHNTYAFYFEKPTGFEFKAGQFVGLTLIDPPETDAKGNRRNFTIASAPFEKDLMIATRIRDTAFKRNLRAMPVGNEVKMLGPFGNFIFAEVAEAVVFLAGGIGITPFRSMALQAARDQSTTPLYLFYSNRRPEDAAFLKELESLEHVAPAYKFIPTMTANAGSTDVWQGETGYIDQNMLEKFLNHHNTATYYVAGPSAMIAAMVQLLKQFGVTEQRIRTEEFTGY